MTLLMRSRLRWPQPFRLRNRDPADENAAGGGALPIRATVKVRHSASVKEYPMSAAIARALSATMVITSLVWLDGDVAAAATRHHRTAVVVHPHHWGHAARLYSRAPLYDGGGHWPASYGWVAPSERPIAMPGYVYLPGHGIVGSPCDMPDSACTNEYRNVR
jgi:hypothetical protein